LTLRGMPQGVCRAQTSAGRGGHRAEQLIIGGAVAQRRCGSAAARPPGVLCSESTSLSTIGCTTAMWVGCGAAWGVCSESTSLSAIGCTTAMWVACGAGCVQRIHQSVHERLPKCGAPVKRLRGGLQIHPGKPDPPHLWPASPAKAVPADLAMPRRDRPERPTRPGQVVTCGLAPAGIGR